MNANCAACRLAKVKCDRVQPTCGRCSRHGIACVFDQRRSRWDVVNVSNKTAPPTAVAQDPAYAELAASLSMFKSRASVSCFRARLFEQLGRLVDLAIQRDDAAALSWATALMHEHGFSLSDFPALHRDSGSALHDVDESLRADADFGFAPALAAVFHDVHPCFGWVQVGTGEKTVVANAAFPADAHELQAAQSLESQADLCGVHRADYTRGAEACYAAVGAEIARAAARGESAEEVLLVLPPRPSRMLVRAPHTAAEKRFRLVITHTHIHISRGGKRVAGIVQYAPAPSANSGGGGGGGGRKRKAAEGLSGLLSDAQLEQWLQEVGSSDAMLEGLLGL